ncbi:hypothetical protein HN604_00615 [archaeon]|mgnify:CR=1 FL=1|jgi:hypothetical protein|nr:hypothetical protein [archaeon]MBT7251305.1 hypothetical protein [archaeon]MBT7660568.1 hypothetical protein [archaeon]
MEEGKNKSGEIKVTEIIGNGFLEQFSLWIFLIGFVILGSSLVSSAEGCCSLDSSGVDCTYIDSAECPSSSSFQDFVSCDDAAFCQGGCCYDDSIGSYDVSVLEANCATQWSPDSTCDSVPGSEPGCCILGDSVNWVTEGACAINSDSLGVETDWDSSISYAECQEIPSSQDRGACVLEGGFCSISTQETCSSIGGDFSSGYLCTALSLDTVCLMNDQTECVSDLDQVYFIDSCGNQANIYDSSKVGVQSYWETMISPEQSCNFGDSNANSAECGNCDYFKSSSCSSAIEDSFNVDYGTNYCKDLSCEFDGEPFNNGDSWCRYDGAIGSSDDVVGSRHWRYSCNQGVIDIDPCNDYRQEVCVQKNTKENGEIVFREGSCLANPWQNCFDLNNNFAGAELVEECKSAISCRMQGVSINPGDSFGFNRCVPQYPSGFDLKTEESAEEAVNICNQGTARCVIPRKRKWDTSCKIKDNAHCEDAAFTEQMNDFCMSLGDCGGAVNYNGDFKKNYAINGAPDLSASWIQSLISLATPIEGQYAILEDYSVYLELFGINGEILRGRELNSPFAAAFIIPAYYSDNPDWYNVLDRPLTFDNWYDWVFGSCSSINVDYSCNVWQPPVGGENCDACNHDPLKPCSKYRCETLGASCEILNEGEETDHPEEIICINGGAQDSNPPIITPLYEVVSSTETYSSVTSNGYSVTSLSGGCLEAYVPITFGITSDEPAICHYDSEQSLFENMSGDLSQNIYRWNHSLSINLPDPSHGQSLGASWTGDLDFFILCQDSNGHETPNFYKISMCVNQGPDTSAPIITGTSPESDSFVSFDMDSTDAQVYTNELSQCKWSLIDEPYSSMANDFSCIDSLGFQSSPFGYVCSDILPTENETNQFYIRCADQQWLIGTSNESDINANEVSYSYVLKKPDKKIEIDWMTPDINFEIASESVSVDLNVKTSGGGDGHRCYYSITEDGMNIPMFLPDENNVHSQPALNLFPQQWTFYITCVDELGDSVEDQTSFEIIYDDNFPRIIRVWDDFGEIFLITDEPSECRYSIDSCSFNWENATSMGDELIHVIDSVPGREYFVKCEDEFGNTPSGCSLSVVAL